MLSLQAFFVFLIFGFFVLSQFGKRLAAKSSPLWWLTFIFLAIAALMPDFYRPIANLLGIELVSNFVLASMIVLLLGGHLSLEANSTIIARKVRQMVAWQAAESFIRTSKHPDATGRTLIVIPCYNEEDAIARTIQELQEFKATQPEFDLCFVNDGSQDQTLSMLRKLAPGEYTSHQVNIGVSGVLTTGFLIAKELNYYGVIQIDGDGQHPAEHIPALKKQAIDTQATLVIGSRYIGCRPDSEQLASTTKFRRLGGIIISRAISLLFHKSSVTDPTSGMRAYSRRAIDLLLPAMPDEYPEPESIAILAQQGGTIAEVAVTMRPRSSGKSSLAGIRSLQFMVKVLTALMGLRLRKVFK